MRAPAHLSAPSRAWWASVTADYALEPHHIRLLTLCAESWDRCEQARLVLAADGLTFTDRFGQPRSRPEVAIERDARVGFARLLRELALDVEPPKDTRSPGITGGRR